MSSKLLFEMSILDPRGASSYFKIGEVPLQCQKSLFTYHLLREYYIARKEDSRQLPENEQNVTKQ